MRHLPWVLLISLFALLVPAGVAMAQLAVGITVKNQAVQAGHVVMDNVVALQQGWVAIYADASVRGNPGAMIGQAPVEAGVTSNVSVPIDVSKATPVLHAVLHVDQGIQGKFEYPGPDVPVIVDGEIIGADFTISGVPGLGTEAPGTSLSVTPAPRPTSPARVLDRPEAPASGQTVLIALLGPLGSTRSIAIIAAGMLVAVSLGLIVRSRVLARRRN